MGLSVKGNPDKIANDFQKRWETGPITWLPTPGGLSVGGKTPSMGPISRYHHGLSLVPIGERNLRGGAKTP